MIVLYFLIFSFSFSLQPHTRNNAINVAELEAELFGIGIADHFDEPEIGGPQDDDRMAGVCVPSILVVVLVVVLLLFLFSFLLSFFSLFFIFTPHSLLLLSVTTTSFPTTSRSRSTISVVRVLV